MGNTASSDKHSTSSNSPKETSHAAPDARDPHAHKKVARRRESVPALPHRRATAAPPSAALESAQGIPSQHIASGTAQAHAHSHTRGRSQTSAIAPSNKSDQRPKSDAAVLERYFTAPDARPVDVPSHPVPTDPNVQPHPASQLRNADSPSSPSSYHIPNSQFQRPPRLPLPIEKEDFAPGSPIISPAEIPGRLGKDLVSEGEVVQLERKTSVVSSTTVDEDEVVDDFQAHGKATGQMVDTLVEWKEGGERVYVTGSFSGWTKKHRLHRNGPSKDPHALSAIIPLLVGAHHMTFLVDGQMKTSKHLPTAVDYTNVLINYVEVSAEDVPRPSKPVDIQRPAQEQIPYRQPIGIETQGLPPEGQRPTLVPATPDLRPTQRKDPLSAGPSDISSPTAIARDQQPQHQPPSSRPASAAAAPIKTVINNKKYHSEIPTFLQDLDAPEESHRFARASAVMSTQPNPPSLPMFLNKSILNGTLPMKDDASVLVLPNHTVLNHLATTSIKNHVLATSATTRYKRKYVTTIMHRPTTEHVTE